MEKKILLDREYTIKDINKIFVDLNTVLDLNDIGDPILPLLKAGGSVHIKITCTSPKKEISI